MKTTVLEAIGETGLNLPAQIHAGLMANDRMKYYFSLLQMAVARADHPEQPADSLRRERLASGIDNSTLDDFVADARRQEHQYRLPGCAAILQEIVRDVHIMAAPVLAEGTDPEARAGFSERLERIINAIPEPQEDLIDHGTIDALTRAETGKVDSLHRLVMDLHKALNAMQAQLTEERLDGAVVFHVENSDRPLITAFMAGLNRTAPLKFNHPGLGTTVTRAGNKLIIQNDLGTTDAHVIVIHNEGLTVQFTHTDIHPQRIQFLRESLKRYAISWGEEQNRQEDYLSSCASFQLVTGRFDARNSEELLEYLNFLGSRLVFLIDWNRARKQLSGFLRGKKRIALLGWAAEAEIGHRGFLELGGAKLVNRAIEETAGSAMHFGDRLCDVLGDDAAMDFLRFVFRSATEGLRDHQSPGLIHDRIRAELQAHFTSERKRLFELASEQAAMIFELASLVQSGIYMIESGDRTAPYGKLAERAGDYEHSADELVAAAREAIRRRPEYMDVFRLLETADDAADELEEVAFLTQLLAATDPQGEALQALGALSDLLVEAAQEWVKALSHASHLEKPGGPSSQQDVPDLLTAIDALFALEHRADDAQRALTHAAVEKARDFRQLHIYSKMADSLEEASDALKWAGLDARDFLLGSVLNT
jgi:uncharacterized protein Yka (UPF0111/DUF47 family)